MTSKNKKIIYYLKVASFTLGTLVFLFIFYFFFYIELYYSQFKKNVEHIKNVEIGMTEKEVISIMGTPESKHEEVLNDGTIMTFIDYRTNDDSYPYIEISFNLNQKVSRIVSPTGWVEEKAKIQ